MKTLISLITMLGVAICNAGSHANLADSVSVEAGIAYSNTSTSGGLAIRDDSTSASILLGSPLSGGVASVGIDLHRADGETEADVNIAWGAPLTLFNVTLDTEVYFQKIDSSYGGWEEVGVGATYGFDWVEVGASLWHELGSNAGYGVELTASREFTTPVKGLTVSPFIAVNFADSYDAIEVGVSADYQLTEDAVVSAKLSFNDNDADGTAYSLQKDWVVGAALTYSF